MSADAIIVGIVVGLVTGAVSAVGSWWLLYRWFAPRMSWTDWVAHYPVDTDPTLASQLELDTGPRAVIEVRVTVSLEIPNLLRKGSKESFRICEYEGPYFRANRRMKYRVYFDLAERSLKRYVSHLKEFREPIERGDPVDVKRLLEAYPRSILRTTAVARDDYTGATRVARREYTAADFREGRFPVQSD